MKERGISLIALIITIIVIIILAVVVVASAGDVIEDARFAKFEQEFGEYQQALQIAATQKKAELVSSGKTNVTDAQVYYMVATGLETLPEGKSLADLEYDIQPSALTGTTYYEVTRTYTEEKEELGGVYATENNPALNRTTPFYSSTEHVYVTDSGEAFTLPGYPRTKNGVTQHYVNEKKYYIGEAQKGEEDPEEQKKEIEVGDYVAYVPDVLKENTDQNPSWRIWSMDENTVTITPVNGIESLTLRGYSGWNTSEADINNACKKYTNTSLGVTEDKLRSMVIDDIESALLKPLTELANGDSVDDPYDYSFESSDWKELPNNGNYGDILGVTTGWLANAVYYDGEAGSMSWAVRAVNQDKTFSETLEYGSYEEGGDYGSLEQTYSLRPLIAIDKNILTMTGGNGSSTSPWKFIK